MIYQSYNIPHGIGLDHWNRETSVNGYNKFGRHSIFLSNCDSVADFGSLNVSRGRYE